MRSYDAYLLPLMPRVSVESPTWSTLRPARAGPQSFKRTTQHPTHGERTMTGPCP